MNLNGDAFIRSSRSFPTNEPEDLSIELNTMYNELAQATNYRTVGTFAANGQIATGELWYLTSTALNGSRQTYTIPSGSSPILIPHGIAFGDVLNVTRLWGTFQNASGVYCTLPFVSTTAANQIMLQVDSTNIIITSGGGAPAISNGLVTIEWITN